MSAEIGFFGVVEQKKKVVKSIHAYLSIYGSYFWTVIKLAFFIFIFGHDEKEMMKEREGTREREGDGRER